jgi:hypothetical protein
VPRREELSARIEQACGAQPRRSRQGRENLAGHFGITEAQRGLGLFERQRRLGPDVALEIAAQLVVVPEDVARAGQRQHDAARQHQHGDQLGLDRQASDAAADHG